MKIFDRELLKMDLISLVKIESMGIYKLWFMIGLIFKRLLFFFVLNSIFKK